MSSNRRLPGILQASEDFQRQLLAREAAAFDQMARAYVQAERRLLPQLEAIIHMIEAKRATGVEVSWAEVAKLARYKQLMRDLVDEAERYAAFTSQIVSGEQSAAIELALREAETLTRTALPFDKQTAMDVMATWNRVPAGALESMVGFAGDGSPLMPAMARRFGDAAEAVDAALRNGITLGWHPTKTVRELRGTMEKGLLENALTWARTEQIRASRETSRRSYEANPHIVKGWVRKAALDDRTCAACIMLDGREYGPNETMDDHPRGRCRMLPMTIGYSDILGVDVGDVGGTTVDWGTGRQWFDAKTNSDKLTWLDEHLGKGAGDAWKAGRLDLAHIPQLNRSEEWGNSYTVTPMRVLVTE